MTKPVYSAGARYERKAFITYLSRHAKDSASPIWEVILAWVRARRSRYDKKPGGL